MFEKFVAVLLMSELSFGDQTLKERISALVPHLNKYSVKSNTPLNLTCDRDNKLPKLDNGLKYTWYFTPSTDPFVDFSEADKEHNHIMIIHPGDENYAYLYCVDPITQNIVSGFQMLDAHHRPVYQHTDTTCSLHDDYWTVLSCRDTLKPPTKIDRCVWKYRPFGHLTETDIHEADDFIFLGDPDVFPEREGVYDCKCVAKTTWYKLMTFTVNKTTGENDRDIATYQFCLHVEKRKAKNNTVSEQLGVTDAVESVPCDKTGYIAGLGVMGSVIVLLVVFFVLYQKHRNYHSVPQSPVQETEMNN